MFLTILSPGFLPHKINTVKVEKDKLKMGPYRVHLTQSRPVQTKSTRPPENREAAYSPRVSNPRSGRHRGLLPSQLSGRHGALFSCHQPHSWRPAKAVGPGNPPLLSSRSLNNPGTKELPAECSHLPGMHPGNLTQIWKSWKPSCLL